MERREFLGVLAFAALCRGETTPSRDDVTIVDFADNGERRGVVRVPKVVKSEAEWRKQLSPLASWSPSAVCRLKRLAKSLCTAAAVRAEPKTRALPSIRAAAAVRRRPLPAPPYDRSSNCAIAISPG